MMCSLLSCGAITPALFDAPDWILDTMLPYSVLLCCYLEEKGY